MVGPVGAAPDVARRVDRMAAAFADETALLAKTSAGGADAYPLIIVRGHRQEVVAGDDVHRLQFYRSLQCPLITWLRQTNRRPKQPIRS